MSTRDKIFQRQLGRTGVYVEAMALGCYSMSNSYGAGSDAESRKVIQEAVDQGITLIDTADYYGWGHNEQLVASALGGGGTRCCSRQNSAMCAQKVAVWGPAEILPT